MPIGGNLSCVPYDTASTLAAALRTRLNNMAKKHDYEYKLRIHYKYLN